MRKILFLFLLLMAGSVSLTAQMRFSANANVYNDKNNQKVGTQYIAANIGSNGVGTMTLGSLTTNAIITNSKRDNYYKMTAYSATLRTSDGKTVEAVITKRDEGTYSVVVYYADGTLRYDFSTIAQSNRSYQYEGKVGPYPVHMQLLFRSDHSVTGGYYYDSQRAKGNDAIISLRGVYTGDVDNGQISLKEYGTTGKEIGSFFCELKGGHDTFPESGMIIFLHLIEGGSGYRNYASDKVYEVHLECTEVSEL